MSATGTGQKDQLPAARVYAEEDNMPVMEKQQPPQLLEALPDPAEVKAWMTRFKQIKGACIDEADYATFNVYNKQTKQWEPKKAMKRTGFQKLSSFLRLRDHIVDKELKILEMHPLRYVWTVTTEVVTPGGRVVQGVGACSNNEREFGEKEDHIVFTIAATRSKNRAQADAMGSADVSAEEFSVDVAEKSAEEEGAAYEQEYKKTTTPTSPPTAEAPQQIPRSEQCEKCNVLVSRHPTAKDGGLMVDRFCCYNPDQVWRLKVEAMLATAGQNVADFKKWWRMNDQEKTWVR